MLKICGFVVFFSSFTGALGTVLSSLGVSQTVKAVLFSFFELSCGVASASGITDSFVAALVAAFAVGWSGISVHFQMIGICDDVRPPLMRYFFAKLLSNKRKAPTLFESSTISFAKKLRYVAISNTFIRA